jgi:ABC-type dipeptide/oligopeptide/nickel transport system ATPase component
MSPERIIEEVCLGGDDNDQTGKVNPVNVRAHLTATHASAVDRGIALAKSVAQIRELQSKCQQWSHGVISDLCTARAWYTQVWKHSLLWNQLVKCEAYTTALYRSSLLSAGKVVKLATSNLTDTINHLLIDMVPEHRIRVELNLVGDDANDDRRQTPHAPCATNKRISIVVAVSIAGTELDIQSLSGGQFFAVQLAAMLATARFTGTKFILLDEALMSMDSKTLNTAMYPLLEYAHTMNAMVLCVAHNVDVCWFENVIDVDASADAIVFEAL